MLSGTVCNHACIMFVAGAVVLNVLRKPDEWNGKIVPMCGSPETMEQYIGTFSKVTGKKAAHHEVPLEEMAKQNEEFAHMFGFFQEFGTFAGHDIGEAPKAAGRPLTTWEQWLKKTGYSGPAGP